MFYASITSLVKWVSSPLSLLPHSLSGETGCTVQILSLLCVRTQGRARGSGHNAHSPIQTSPNCPDPSFRTSLRDCRGISHSSWAQGFSGARLTQGWVSFWHKPSPFSVLEKKKWGWRLPEQLGSHLFLESLTSLSCVPHHLLLAPPPPQVLLYTCARAHTRTLSSLQLFGIK